MPDSLLPDLPEALESLVRSMYPEPELARRALLAPWPFLGFRSAYEERALWAADSIRDAKAEQRRLAFEKSLREEGEPFRRVEQPYFVSVHTQGTIRSPYPELSDAEFWLYMTLYGSEQATRQWLEGKMVPSLGWKTTLEYLHDAAHPSFLASIRKRLSSGKAHDPHLAAWSAQTDLLYPSYS